MKVFHSIVSPWIVQGPVHEIFRYVNPFVFVKDNLVHCTLAKVVSKQWHHRVLLQSLLFVTAPIRRLFYMFGLFHNFAEVGTFHRDISTIHVKPSEFNGIPILAIQNPDISNQEVLPYKHRLQAQDPMVIHNLESKCLLAKFDVKPQENTKSILCVSPIESDNAVDEMVSAQIARSFNVVGHSGLKFMFQDPHASNVLYFQDTSHVEKHTVVKYNVETAQRHAKDIQLYEAETSEQYICQTPWTQCPVHLAQDSQVSIFQAPVSKRYFVALFCKETWSVKMGRMPLQFSPRIESIESISSLNTDTLLIACNLVRDASMVFQVPWTIFWENV